ncbi:cytochrome P450 [Actinocorallia aurea]
MEQTPPPLACPFSRDTVPVYPFDSGKPGPFLNPIYGKLGPGVHPIWLGPSDRPAYLVNGHALLKHVMESHEDFGQLREPLPGVVPIEGTLLALEGERHKRVRRPAAPSFTPKAVDARRARIREQVVAHLERVAALGRPVDMVADFGARLTLEVLGDTIGVPADDLPQFLGWGDRFLDLTDPADARAAVGEMAAYVGRLFQQRQTDPGTDVLSAYVGGRGSEVSQADAVMMGVAVIVGGWETTTTIMTSSLYWLLTFPQRWRELVDDTGLIPGALQELLRTRPASADDGPPRVARHAVVLDGVEIPAGSIIVGAKSGASADPGVFPDPEKVDFRRPNASDHLAFGAGPHICLGKPLAVAVLEITLEELAIRYPNARLTGEPVEWRQGSGARRPLRLPVILD